MSCTKPGCDVLGAAHRSADLGLRLEHEDRPAGVGEVVGGDEPVGAGADDDGVVRTRSRRFVLPGDPREDVAAEADQSVALRAMQLVAGESTPARCLLSARRASVRSLAMTRNSGPTSMSNAHGTALKPGPHEVVGETDLRPGAVAVEAPQGDPGDSLRREHGRRRPAGEAVVVGRLLVDRGVDAPGGDVGDRQLVQVAVLQLQLPRECPDPPLAQDVRRSCPAR